MHCVRVFLGTRLFCVSSHGVRYVVDNGMSGLVHSRPQRHRCIDLGSVSSEVELMLVGGVACLCGRGAFPSTIAK